ncbi:hypothetical protein LZK98_03285 [Sphingomonas cannabina]|uniref:hypothetical protein n=1 Tax=Sphingomonas cannabina TaxID=2899123 RepID=UPI001F163D73|nr:hypothetical protein [Sphingomonas cannabina]UIJ45991.1 hypothetical protein LZK98_03285 [Sphingomonas cannabina]
MKLPKSLWFFVAAAIAFLLQLLPIPGIFLMILTASAWPGFLVNIGFLGIAVEALTRRASFYWLIVPTIWFGGYAAVAWRDHLPLQRLEQDVARRNASASVDFDPLRQSLVLVSKAREMPGSPPRAGLSLDEQEIVAALSAPVIYIRDPATARSQFSGASHIAIRTVDRLLCDEMEEPAFRNAGILTFAIFDLDGSGTSRMEDRDSRFCALGLPEDPILPPIEVERSQRESRIGLLPVSEITVTATMPDGTRRRMYGGSVHPLPWFPKPILGCALDSGAAAWRCFAHFSRDDVPLSPVLGSRFGGDDTAPALVQMLGVRRITAATRRGADSSMVLAKARAVQEHAIADATAKLDKAVDEDMSAPIGYGGLDVLLDRTDIIRPRLASIVEAMERSAAVNGTARDNVRQMLAMVKRLPPELVEPFRERIDVVDHYVRGR